MRTLTFSLLSFLLASTAYAQVIDTSQQSGWDLRRSDSSAISEPIRLRPGADTSILTQPAANLAPAVNAPYTGYKVFGGTLALGTGLGTYYDDNVFATNANRRSDWVFVARPEFAWQSFGPGYAVGVDGFLEGKAFDTYNSENQVNASIGSSFKVMPTNDSQVLGNVRYTRGHLDRGTSETVTSTGVLLGTLFNKPIEYDQGIAALVYNKRFDAWWMSVGANGTIMQFGNPDIGGIARVNLGYANGHVETANLRVGTVVAPLTSVFGEVVGNTRNFRVNAFGSNGYRAVVGALFEPGPGSRIRGEVWGGYMNQDYNGASFKTVSTFTYGGSLAFQLTDQLSMGIDGRREAKEAALSVGILGPGEVGVSDALCAVASAACVSAVQSTIGGRFDYRILPNLGVAAGATYIIDQYLGTLASGRTDRTLSPFASIKYAATNRVSVGFDYRRINFDPSGGFATGIVAPSYERNVYLISMAGKF